jgi:tRNA 2-thiouridine synthesizing protein A
VLGVAEQAMATDRDDPLIAGAQVCDVRHLACPVSLLRVKQTVRGLPPGALIQVRCADPMVALDVQAWARQSGHDIVASIDETTVMLRVAG